MATERSSAGVADFSLSSASLIAGGGLLLMAVLSFASLPIIEGMRVPGDAAATVANIAGNDLQFRLSILALLGVIVLDVVIAVALYAFLRPVHRALALLAAVLRVTYAAVFGAALGHLLAIGGLVDGGTAASAFGPDQLAALVAVNYDAFSAMWEIGLAISGVHLLVVALGIARAVYVPTAVGALVAVAGVGYVIDPLTVIVLGESFGVIVVTFVGEVVLLAWLLYRGRTLDATASRPSTA